MALVPLAPCLARGSPQMRAEREDVAATASELRAGLAGLDVGADFFEKMAVLIQAEETRRQRTRQQRAYEDAPPEAMQAAAYDQPGSGGVGLPQLAASRGFGPAMDTMHLLQVAHRAVLPLAERPLERERPVRVASLPSLHAAAPGNATPARPSQAPRAQAAQPWAAPWASSLGSSACAPPPDARASPSAPNGVDGWGQPLPWNPAAGATPQVPHPQALQQAQMDAHWHQTLGQRAMGQTGRDATPWAAPWEPSGASSQSGAATRYAQVDDLRRSLPADIGVQSLAAARKAQADDLQRSQEPGVQRYARVDDLGRTAGGGFGARNTYAEDRAPRVVGALPLTQLQQHEYPSSRNASPAGAPVAAPAPIEWPQRGEDQSHALGREVSPLRSPVQGIGPPSPELLQQAGDCHYTPRPAPDHYGPSLALGMRASPLHGRPHAAIITMYPCAVSAPLPVLQPPGSPLPRRKGIPMQSSASAGAFPALSLSGPR